MNFPALRHQRILSNIILLSLIFVLAMGIPKKVTAQSATTKPSSEQKAVPKATNAGTAVTATPPAVKAPDSTQKFVPSIPFMSKSGMVVTAHPIASNLAANTLRTGGNAADAGITALAALSVAESQASGLGGGGFCLYYDAKTQFVSVTDYRETAPAGVVPDSFYQPADSFRLKLQTKGTAIVTPGAWLGWDAIYKKYGTKKLDALLAPVVTLADTGYVPSEKLKAMIVDHADGLASDDSLNHLYLSRDEELKPIVNPRIKLPGLAKTYRAMGAAQTFTLFRQPPMRDNIVKTVQAAGGALSASDLDKYRTIERQPLKITYRGYDIYTLPMPSAGGTAVSVALKILEKMDLKAKGWNSPELIHVVAEAIRQGMTDGYVWGGDPLYVSVKTDYILGDSHIDSSFAKLPLDSARERAVPYDTITAHGNTTHLVIADNAGDLLSATQSINYFFGSDMFDREDGILFNNHAADFVWRPGRRNSIAPNHRPISWMSPVIVLKDGKPWLVAGTPGGPRIPATMVELLVALIDFNMPLNEAMDAPRYFPNGKRLEYEPRIPSATLDNLKKKGWKLSERGSMDNYFGGAQAIQFMPDGSKVGVGDPRRDGAAAGE